MAEILAVKASARRCDLPSAVEATRAEALFLSALQCSDAPAPDQVRRAVATTMRRVGVGACAAHMASEFGEHPDTAAERMIWALATVRTAYPAALTAMPTRSPLPLALAS